MNKDAQKILKDMESGSNLYSEQDLRNSMSESEYEDYKQEQYAQMSDNVQANPHTQAVLSSKADIGVTSRNRTYDRSEAKSIMQSMADSKYKDLTRKSYEETFGKSVDGVGSKGVGLDGIDLGKPVMQHESLKLDLGIEFSPKKETPLKGNLNVDASRTMPAQVLDPPKMSLSTTRHGMSADRSTMVDAPEFGSDSQGPSSDYNPDEYD